jgi:hypothetical protein
LTMAILHCPPSSRASRTYYYTQRAESLAESSVYSPTFIPRSSHSSADWLILGRRRRRRIYIPGVMHPLIYNYLHCMCLRKYPIFTPATRVLSISTFYK